jgi:hypothetical protein
MMTENTNIKITYTTSLLTSVEFKGMSKVECKLLTDWARQEVERAVNRWVYENDINVTS